MTSWSLVLALAASVRTLVLPFENSSHDGSPDWRGSAFEEAVTSHLQAAGIEVPDLASRHRQSLEKGFVPGEPLTRASAIVLAKDLGCDRLILGEFRPGASLEVTARLLDLSKGSTVGVVSDYGPPEKLAELASQVAKNLFRLERDEAPPGFDDEASRRKRIPLDALEAGARARMSLEPEERRSYLESALRKSPEYLEARILLGRMLLEEGRHRDAIEVLASAKGEGHLYGRAYFDLGLAYLHAGESWLALDVYQSLSALPDAPAAVHNNLGVALMDLHRFVEAGDAFERARRADPDSKTHLFNLGWSQWRAGKGAAALLLFEELVDADPLDAEARFLLAAAASSQARPELAETSRAGALVLAPHLEQIDAATVEGWARPAAREHERAPLGWAGATIEMEEDVVGLSELFDARELRSRGRSQEALQILQRCLYRDANALACRRELAEIYFESGELDKAASELSVLLWTGPSPEDHVQLARIFLEMEEPQKAIEQVERALALDPDHAGARGLRTEMAPP